MLKYGYPVLGVADPQRAEDFWAAALGLVPTDEWRDDDWRTLCHPDGGRALALQRSDSPPEPRPRMHLDLLVDTTAEQQHEVDRLVALGAARVDWRDYPDAADFVVLADPDGNLFCVVDLSRAPSGSKRR